MLKKIENRYKVSVEARLLFSEKLDYLLRVFTDSTSNISSDIKNIEDKYYQELGQDMTELSEEDFEYHKSEVSQLEHAAKHFPQILYRSTIVSAHSIFESTLSQMRIETETQIKSRIKLKQLRPVGNEIENILNYLKLVHQTEFPDSETELKKLKSYVLIRNSIVHQNGNIHQIDQSRKNAIKKFVENESHVVINQLQDIEFKKKFVTKYIAFLHKTGHQLFEQFSIENRYVKD